MISDIASLVHSDSFCFKHHLFKTQNFYIQIACGLPTTEMVRDLQLVGLFSSCLGFSGCLSLIILLHFGLRPYNKICKQIMTRRISSIKDYTIELKLSDS